MEDRDLTRVEGKIDALALIVNQMAVAVGAIGVNVEDIHDHEIRIRGLERFRYAFPSVAVVAVALSALALLH
jgi:hypothetical protein